jgi:hypothetical protein
VDCFRTIYTRGSGVHRRTNLCARTTLAISWCAPNVHHARDSHCSQRTRLAKTFWNTMWCDHVSLLRPSHVGCYSCRSAGSLFPDGIPILLWRLHSFVVSSRLLMCEFLTFPWKKLVFPRALAAWSVRRSWLSVEIWLTYKGARGWRLCQSCSCMLS